MSLARSAFAATLMGLALNASADLSDVPSGAYSLDKNHAYITFTYSHHGYSTPHVSFRSFDVSFVLDNENPANSSVEVMIDATSIDSRVDIFDDHLNGANFFDTENHPTITFESTSFEAAGDDKFNIVGELTMMGITKPLTLEATLLKAAEHPMKKIPAIGATATATLSRSEWELSRAVPNVGDEVTIHISVEFTKSPENIESLVGG